MSWCSRVSGSGLIPYAAGLLLGVRLIACSSTDASQGGARLATDAGNSGGAPPSTGGYGGSGGVRVPCNRESDCTTSTSCQGNTLVTVGSACDYPGVCTGTVRRTLSWCPGSCEQGRCLSRAAPPSIACTTVDDCGLPQSVCAGVYQMVFTDPACEAGQCRWKQILNTCGPYGASCLSESGTCAPGPSPMTAGPILPNPMALETQPAQAPAQACAAVTDCTQPPPGCFGDSILSYVNPACVGAQCAWEITLSQCFSGCAAGQCL